MVVADTNMIEMYNQKLSELRQNFFERSDGAKLASNELPPLIEKLRTFAMDGSKPAKRVLGRALHLSSLLACHRMDYGTFLHELNEMIDYARDLRDGDMEAAALIRQGLLYSYEFRPCQHHYAFHRAMQLLNKVQSPLVRACVLYGYAESLAASGQVKLAGVQRYFEAERHFERAESVSVPNDDPGHAYIHENSVARAIHRARFFVARSRCREAVELLTEMYSHDATPDNVEVLSLLAQAYAHLVLRQQGEDSFERACFFIETLVDTAKHMGSRLYHSQAQIYYEFLMLSKYHHNASKCLLHVVAF
jgi:hypothetical protein